MLSQWFTNCMFWYNTTWHLNLRDQYSNYRNNRNPTKDVFNFLSTKTIHSSYNIDILKSSFLNFITYNLSDLIVLSDYNIHLRDFHIRKGRNGPTLAVVRENKLSIFFERFTILELLIRTHSMHNLDRQVYVNAIIHSFLIIIFCFSFCFSSIK